MNQSGRSDQAPGLETQDFDANHRRSDVSNPGWLHATDGAMAVVDGLRVKRHEDPSELRWETSRDAGSIAVNVPSSRW